MRLFEKYKRSVEPKLVDVLVAFIVITSGIMLLQLVLGIFEPVSALLLSLLVCGGIGLFFVQRVNLPRDLRNIAAIILMGVLITMPRWNPFLYVEGGQDQGIYISMSSHFARTGGLEIEDKVRTSLPEDQKLEYDKNNQIGIHNTINNKYEGSHQLGVYIRDLNSSNYVFQFYPLHPLWMAMVGKVMGEQFRVYSLVGFSLLNILMLSLLVFELSDRKRAPAFMVAALLAINPMHVFLSRFPVTENVSVFFSASAIYYLVLFFKRREQNIETFWHLLLSAGAWSCLFFVHIGGFMFAPIILLSLLAGVITAKSKSGFYCIAGYGVLVFGAYWLSLWYGMTKSFPYSYDIYRSVFGSTIGNLFIRQWPTVTLFLLLFCFGVIYLTHHFKYKIQFAWNSRGFRQWLISLIRVILFFTVVIGIYSGYRLGFSDDYLNDEYINRIYHLNNTGFAGFSHSSLVSIAVYLSPFLLLFVLTMIAQTRYRLGIYEILLVVFIALFLVLRTALDSFIPYYYYGRYLSSELLPYLTVLAALWLNLLLVRREWYWKTLVGSLFGLTVIWQTTALAQQYPGGDMYRLDASLQPLIQRMGSNDLLIVSGIKFPALTTGLNYYYGKNTVYANPGSIRDAIRKYSATWSDVYVLSDLDNIDGLTYLSAISLVRDTYGRDILPVHPVELPKLQFYLYQANRPQMSYLQVGDRINFGKNGNAGRYIISGWSGQESEMRWTEGESASIVLPMAEISSNLTLRINLASFNCVDASVRVNGVVRSHWSFKGCRGYEERIIVLSKDDMTTGKVNISFDIPKVKSPHDLDVSNSDSRKLGLSFKSIEIEI